MSKTIALGITITALGAGAAAAAFGTVGNRVDALGRTIDSLKARQKSSLAAMEREWTFGGNAVKRYATEVEKLDDRIKKLAANKARLEALGQQHEKNRADMNSRIGGAMAAYGIGMMAAAPVGAFVRQDEALNALQVAMMDKSGQVAEGYKDLKKQVIELGNALPGTTADFAGTARTLMEQGVAMDSVLGGGLKAASYLSVALRVPADQAGEMTAKLREAYKLSDDELTKMADSMQRAKFAFGMKPEDLMAASSYQAPMLNQLGISGIGNTNKMLALQGMAAQVGLEGSSFGTNFSMMLTRLAKGPEMIEQANKGMKKEAKEIMDTMGLTFDFFDKKGNFAGLDHMVKELEKLKLIKAKLGDKAAMEVSEAMFGAEAGRPAMIIAEQGKAGFEAAQKRMADQASLQQRIDKTLQSTRNTWDALTGSVENFAAAAVGPAVQALNPVIGMLNRAAGALTNFAEEHPVAVKWIGLAAGAVLGLTASFLGMGAAMAVVRFALTGAQLIPGMGMLANALGAGKVAVLAFGKALWGLVANPVGATIAAIAVGALLIYKNWAPISGWFRQAWADVKSECTRIWPFFESLPGKFKAWGSEILNGLIAGIKAKIGEVKDAIVGVGSSVKGWFADTLGIQSPSRVFKGMGDMVGEGLRLGMLGKVPGVQAAGKGLAAATMAVALAGQGAASSKALPGRMPAAGGSGAANITYAPVINVAATAPDEVRQQVDQALKLSQTEFEKMLSRAGQNKARKGFV